MALCPKQADSFAKISPAAKQCCFLFMKEVLPSRHLRLQAGIEKMPWQTFAFEKPKVQFAKTGNLLASPGSSKIRRMRACGKRTFPRLPSRWMICVSFIPCMEPIRLMGPRFSSCTRAAITLSGQVWVHGSHMGWGRKTKIFLPSYPFARPSLMAGPRTGGPPFFPILIRAVRLAMHRLIRRRQGWGTFPTSVIPSSSKRLRFE